MTDFFFVTPHSTVISTYIDFFNLDYDGFNKWESLVNVLKNSVCFISLFCLLGNDALSGHVWCYKSALYLPPRTGKPS